jgi:TolB-like protein
MKTAILVLSILVCITSFSSAHAQGGLDQRVSELTLKISNGLTENQKRTIAVVEFADLRGNVTDFGRFIAEELITHLYETKKFKVIERQLLNKVITEQKLSLTGIVDQTSAQKLGKLLGVDAIATGTVTDLGKSLRVNARLIDTSTGEIFAVAQTEVAKDDAVTKLMGGDSSTSSDSGRTNQPSSASKSRTQKVEAQFFTFELQRCRLSGTTVACDLTVTNNDKDRRLAICVGGVIFDDFGNRYDMYVTQLANEQGSAASAYLIGGIKTKARATFERVSPEATKIALMSLSICQVEGGAGFNLQFRNIPLRDQSPTEEQNENSNENASANFGRQETFSIYGNREWTDTGSMCRLVCAWR